MKYVKIKPLKNTPVFRKIALGTWARPGDPQIYGTLEVDLTAAYKWRDQVSKGPESPKISILHMTARAVGLVMEKYPDLNGLLRFGKVYLREDVDVSVLVTVEHPSGRNDLTGLQIKNCNKKSVQEIAKWTSEKVDKLRDKKGESSEMQKSARMLSFFPSWMVKFLLSLTAFIGYTLNLKLPGMPSDSFGSSIITNVGGMGLELAYAPLVPYSRVPIVLLLGEAKKRPVVVDDKIELRETVLMNFTVDHRFCDGMLLSKMAKMLHEIFENPETSF